MAAIDEMRHETAQQNNGVLADTYATLAAAIATGEATLAAKLTKAVIGDELAKRNADLRHALDEWESDLDTADTVDDVVLRHAKRMRRNVRFHVAERLWVSL